MAEDKRNKAEREANLSYEEMMAKRKKEAQEEAEKKLKPESKNKKEPKMTVEMISYGESS